MFEDVAIFYNAQMHVGCRRRPLVGAGIPCICIWAEMIFLHWVCEDIPCTCWLFHEQHSCGNVFVIRPSTPQWLVQAIVSAPRTVVPMYFILLHFAGSWLLALFNTLPFPYHLIAQLFSLQTCSTIPSESLTRILFMRACILSGFAIPGDAHGIRLLCFVFDPFLGLLLPVDFVIESCRCEARGSCHKAAKPWPSIPCTLLGRRKELAFFSIFQHLQCFMNLCKLWVKDRKRYHALLKKAGKVIKVRKVDELADGLFDFFFIAGDQDSSLAERWKPWSCLFSCKHHTSHKMPQDPHLMVIRKHHGARYYWPKICKGYGMLQVIIDGYCTVE